MQLLRGKTPGLHWSFALRHSNFFVLFEPSWLTHSIFAIPPAFAKRLFPPQDVHDILGLRRDLNWSARVVTEVVDAGYFKILNLPQ